MTPTAAPSMTDLPFLPPAENPSLDSIERSMARSRRVEQVARYLDPDAFWPPEKPDQTWVWKARRAGERRFRQIIDKGIIDARAEALRARRANAIAFAEHLLSTGAVRP